MPPDPLAPFSAVAAYQRLNLAEIRSLCNDLDLDLQHYLAVERSIEDSELPSLEEEMSKLREILLSRGAELSPLRAGELASLNHSPSFGKGKSYGRVHVESPGSFQELTTVAEKYLSEAGVDLSRDPLLQILGAEELLGTVRSYKEKYGDIGWDNSDYLVVMVAGLVATLLDVFLVRIPTDTFFLGRQQAGSPLTKWLKENSGEVHEHLLGRFERVAKVPYDDPRNKLVEGLSPKVHRLMSLGHDPILGFIFGVIDIMSGTGTFMDKRGELIRIDKATNPETLITAFLKVFFHLLSDVCTSAGVQPPFFTLLQLLKSKSPFVLGPSGERVSWTNVARYMYTHGYDLRHFVTMGVVPAAVEMTIRAWWLCRSFEKGEDPTLARAKLTSMLMLAHTIATSGNLIKTGIIFGMNPLALNWAQVLALFPVTVSWVRESMKREHSLRKKLDEEWESVYRARG